MLWLAESKRGGTQGEKGAYSICCSRGKIKLPVALKPPHPLMESLLTNNHPKSSSFLDNIRRYNSMFAFTSMGGKVDHSVNNGRGPFCFRMQGENYHMIGDLLPKPNESPKFAQLYIYDKSNEIQNRINAVRYSYPKLYITI